MSNNSPATLYTVPPMTATEALRKLELAYSRQGIELEMARTALNEWFEKTNWVQEQIGSFPINALGQHRADLMREEIERLRAAHVRGPVLVDAEFTEGQHGYRPPCCDQVRGTACCDSGVCVADLERAEITYGKGRR